MSLAHDAHNVIAAMNIPIEWRLVLFAICQASGSNSQLAWLNLAPAPDAIS